jgi:hypothetical protein
MNKNVPILVRMSKTDSLALGVLPSDVDVREYRQHLDEKYAS